MTTISADDCRPVNTDACFAWGCSQIGRIIGRNPRQTYHLLETGQIRSAKKIGHRWVAERDSLIAELRSGA
jgi:hypothetical protein